MAVGSFDLNPGDTLKFRVITLQGTSEDDVRESIQRFDEFAADGYPLPSPPPAPKLRAIPGDNKVTLLQWSPILERKMLKNGKIQFVLIMVL